MTAQAASGPRAAWVGQTVSHYRVLQAIGGGGMGEVYEAEDLNLGRHVALKFLSSTRERSPEAVQRLEREARAASALNHPHICTVHDIGEHEGERFITMELLDGETVRSRLQRGPLDLRTLLSVGIEVADALDAAHRAHVLHRDVTPANVFLTRSGHAKLLDFGLAKQEAHEVGPELSTVTSDPMLTSPGAVMGTVAYMSPEQVRGDDLDHRTDLFSFGALLYEMATGVRAFPGRTSAIVFDAILHLAPPPATGLNSDLPAGLQAILEKALEKDRELRYHSAEDLRTDLERLKRDVDVEALRHVSTQTARVTELALPRFPSRRSVLGAGGALLLVLVSVGAYSRLWRDDSVPDVPARQVTSGRGVEGEPAVSPDGRMIAFTSDAAGNKDIWLVDVNGGPEQRLTTNDADDTHAAWFPDGRSIAFTSDRRTGERRPGHVLLERHQDIWRAPILDGGAATLLVPDAESPAISPDGATIAFARIDVSGYRRIAVAPVSNPAGARTLTGERDGRWNHSEPAWSPDGKRICYAAWDGLWMVSADGTGARRLTAEEGDQHPSWSADGRHVYFVSYLESSAELCRVDVSGRVRERVTRGSGDEVSPDVSRDGRVLAFGTDSGGDDVVTIELATGREIVEFGTGKGDFFPSFGPGGRVVYFASNRWGDTDIWKQDLQDGRPVGPTYRVFEQPGNKTHPAVSADGTWLAYYRVDRVRPERPRRDVWVVPTAGGAPIEVTSDGNSFHPAWAPDGSALAFGSERKDTRGIWTQRIVDGRPAGEARRITEAWPRFSAFPSWSPDGSTVAFISLGSSGVQDVALVAATGGRPRLVTSGAEAARVRWNARTGALLVSARWGTDHYELRAILPDGSPVAEPGTPLVLGSREDGELFDVSSDGRFIAVTRGTYVGHVWVMETQRRTF